MNKLEVLDEKIDKINDDVAEIIKMMEKLKEESRPEPKFKVGDKVMTIKERPISVRDIYCSEGHYHYFLGDGQVSYHESDLTLAPVEPEWVDVTGECEVTLDMSTNGNYYIDVRHNSSRVFAFYETITLGTIAKDQYDVQLRPNGYTGFKILKRVE